MRQSSSLLERVLGSPWTEGIRATELLRRPGAVHFVLGTDCNGGALYDAEGEGPGTIDYKKEDTI